MKRAALASLSLVLTSGAVWAQAPQPPTTSSDDDDTPPISPSGSIDPQLDQRALSAGDDPSDPGDPNDLDDPDPTDPDDDPSAVAAAAKADPLEISPEIRDRIGVGDDAPRAGAVGDVQRRFRGYYEETRGDYRLRLLPPLMLEHARGLTPQEGKASAASSAGADVEGLYGLLYYRRRSLKLDADVLFPAFWRLREDKRHTWVLGPIVHQQEVASDAGRATHANWLAPLVFEGKRRDGGYLHLPALLTLASWREKSAFTLLGPYLRIRKDKDVDQGLFPLFMHGDNHNADGARRKYTLIPPALFFQRERELTGEKLTVVGPVWRETTETRSITNVMPLFWHIQGRPELSGTRERHTTLLPFFHYGRSEEKSMFVVPGYLRRVTATADTMLTPFYSRATTRNGKTRLQTAGPVLPLFYNYKDDDTNLRWTGLFPFGFKLSSPRGHTFATPLFATDRNYGVNRTTWVFPNIVWGKSNQGWNFDIYPLIFSGRKAQSTHSVLAPVFWDFANPKSRTTIAFPLYWRFASTDTRSLTQVAGNTVYIERRVRGGQDWHFHVAPLFSYGKSPTGHFWNVLFGLAGYSRKGDDAYVRALWIPFRVSGSGGGKDVAGR